MTARVEIGSRPAATTTRWPTGSFLHLGCLPSGTLRSVRSKLGNRLQCFYEGVIKKRNGSEVIRPIGIC